MSCKVSCVYYVITHAEAQLSSLLRLILNQEKAGSVLDCRFACQSDRLSFVVYLLKQLAKCSDLVPLVEAWMFVHSYHCVVVLIVIGKLWVIGVSCCRHYVRNHCEWLVLVSFRILPRPRDAFSMCSCWPYVYSPYRWLSSSELRQMS